LIFFGLAIPNWSFVSLAKLSPIWRTFHRSSSSEWLAFHYSRKPFISLANYSMV